MKDVIQEKLAHLAVATASGGAVIVWLDVIDRMVRIGAGCASIAAALYAVKYYRAKIKARKSDEDE